MTTDPQAEAGHADRCGTYAGWNAHVHAGETPCQACRAAAAAYQREYRQRPHARARRLAKEGAKRRALAALAARYPVEYQQLLQAEEAAQ